MGQGSAATVITSAPAASVQQRAAETTVGSPKRCSRASQVTRLSAAGLSLRAHPEELGCIEAETLDGRAHPRPFLLEKALALPAQ